MTDKKKNSYPMWYHGNNHKTKKTQRELLPMSTITSETRFRQWGVKYSLKYGVTAASNHFGWSRQVIHERRAKWDGKSHRVQSPPCRTHGRRKRDHTSLSSISLILGNTVFLYFLAFGLTFIVTLQLQLFVYFFANFSYTFLQKPIDKPIEKWYNI